MLKPIPDELLVSLVRELDTRLALRAARRFATALYGDRVAILAFETSSDMDADGDQFFLFTDFRAFDANSRPLDFDPEAEFWASAGLDAKTAAEVAAIGSLVQLAEAFGEGVDETFDLDELRWRVGFEVPSDPDGSYAFDHEPRWMFKNLHAEIEPGPAK